jgi:hypothetical protein
MLEIGKSPVGFDEFTYENATESKSGTAVNHCTQYYVLTQRLRTGSKSATTVNHWGNHKPFFKKSELDIGCHGIRLH